MGRKKGDPMDDGTPQWIEESPEATAADAGNPDQPGSPEADAENDGVEFSLEDLSKAYARIVSEQNGNAQEAEEIADEDLGREEAGDDLGLEELDDARDNAGAAIDELTIVEALLFVGVHEGEKLTPRTIASTMRDISPKEIKHIVAKLNQRYEEDGNPYRIALEEGSYKMVLDEAFQPIRDRFYGEVKEAELNHPAVEVLSIIAYQQPITKAEIDRIRQKPSGSIVNQLLGRQILVEVGEGTGKNKTYGTGPRFLELMGLEQIQDLPLAQEVDDIDEFFDGDALGL
jgi:segregation and condensation protein B